MDIYELWADSNHTQVLVYQNEEDVIDFRTLLNGSSIKDKWEPPIVEILKDDEHEDRILSDMVGFYGLPTFSERIPKSLNDILVNNGELLPLESGDDKYNIFNVLNIIDVLDEELSNIKYLSSGKVMKINEYVFNEKLLLNEYIFKIPQLIWSVPLVTDKFVDFIYKNELKGFLFKKVNQRKTGSETEGSPQNYA